MTIKVARVPYLSAEAFYIDMERRGLQLIDMLPEEVAPALRQGEIDAGLVPLADYFAMESQCQPVAGFCVSTPNQARSVLLYSTKPITELTGARIGVAAEDSTTARLLKVMLSLKYEVQPGAYVPLEDSYDAFLITDDQALRRRLGARGYPHRYDLGEEWFNWTGLPFVFSRWIARIDLEPQALLTLEATLYVGLEDGVETLFHESDPRDRLLMLPKDIVEYIQGFRFFIGYSEQKSINLFREYLEQIKLGD